MKPPEVLTLHEDWEQAHQTVLRRRDMADLSKAPEAVREGVRRVFGEDLEPPAAVARILADVQEEGDEALRDWTARIDGLTLGELEVPAGAWESAYNSLPHDLAQVMRLSAERIHAFHSRQPVSSLSWSTTDLGGTMGQRVVPIERVGVYAPGGTAPLPSSLLMAAIPARVAGVEEIVVCTPPRRTDGKIPDVTLAAAHVAGVDRLFRLGGAQAIGALAYGTATVPRVDKIVGAGGMFTTLAKRQVYGQVGLDGLYGPTETLVVADDSANPSWVAADLLAQGEHDILATAILLTPSRSLAQAVQVEVSRQVENLTRAEKAYNDAVDLTEDALGVVSTQTRAVGERAAKLAGTVSGKTVDAAVAVEEAAEDVAERLEEAAVAIEDAGAKVKADADEVADEVAAAKTPAKKAPAKKAPVKKAGPAVK